LAGAVRGLVFNQGSTEPQGSASGIEWFYPGLEKT